MRARLALLTLALAVGGCSNGHAGRFLVVVTSDIPAPDQLATVRVSAGVEAHDFALTETRLPFSFAVDAAPGRAEAEPVTIEVSGLDRDGTTLVTRPVTTTFRTNRTLVVPVELLRRCTPLAQCGAQLRCGASEACTSDGCVSPILDSADLREVTSPGDELGTSLTPEQVCDAFANLYCSAAVRCCPDFSLSTPEQLESFRAECMVTSLANCTENSLPIFNDARTGFDAARAAAALEAGEALARQCSVGLAEWSGSIQRGILSALTGTVPAGGACSFEDGAGLFSCRDASCLPAAGTLDPVCQPRACGGQTCFDHRGILELAQLADAGCADGLFCASSAAGATCAPLVTDDAPCSRDSQCESRVCQRPAGTCRDGAACEYGTQCAVSGCDTASGTCNDGTPCTSDLQCVYRGCAREPGRCARRTVQNVYCPREL